MKSNPETFNALNQLGFIFVNLLLICMAHKSLSNGHNFHMLVINCQFRKRNKILMASC